MRGPLKHGLAFLIILFGGAGAPAQHASVETTPRPAVQLDDQRKLYAALAGLKAQRAGVVDAYVVVAALDADPVFGREAREAGRVLASRFDAAGRTLVLANDEARDRADVPATPETLANALRSVASL